MARVKKKTKKPPSLSGVLPEHLTPKQQNELRACLAMGVPEADACWAVMLHPTVLKRWMAAPYVPGEPVSDFATGLRQAMGRGVVSKVKTVFDGTAQAAQLGAAKWWLAHQRPEKFAAQVPTFGAGTLPATDRDSDISEERLQQAMTVLEGEGAEFPEQVRAVILGTEAA